MKTQASQLRAHVKFIIEHLEDRLSDWLMAEYENCSRITGRDTLIFTNVRRPEWEEKLERLGFVVRRSVSEVELDGRVIVLDPQASVELSPEDLIGGTWIVVGGILGDHPPRGRTSKFLSSRLPNAEKRSLGPHQFAIDGAIYVAKMVAEGKRLDQIPMTIGLEVPIDSCRSYSHVVYLPYAYPVVDGKPLISDKVLELVKTSSLDSPDFI